MPAGERDRSGHLPPSRRFVAAALVGVAALAVIYPFIDERTQSPLAVFLLPVLAVSALGSVRETLTVGAASTLAAWTVGLLGPLDGPPLTARLAILAVSWALAVVVAAVRSRRDVRIAASDARALRISRAMHAGRVGTWQCDRASGSVEWDEDLHALFGLERGDFEDTFDGWVARVHPDDQSRVLAAVDHGMTSGEVFRFDHRCVWPHGSVHWLHGVGEIVVDDEGDVVGAAGLTLDIDERVRLLEVERTAAARARFLERTNRALVESLDLDEVMERITTSAVEGLADWCSLVVTIDQPLAAPIIAVAHADARMVLLAKELQTRFPFDPEGQSGVPYVLRTGEVEFVPVIDAGFLDALDLPAELRALASQELVMGGLQHGQGAHPIELNIVREGVDIGHRLDDDRRVEPGHPHHGVHVPCVVGRPVHQPGKYFIAGGHDGGLPAQWGC